MTPEEKKSARALRRKSRKSTTAVEVDTSSYPRSYGSWAGNTRGFPPDFTRCKTAVSTKGSCGRTHQCHRPNGFGPGAAFCKQHDPEAVSERHRKSQEKWDSAFQDRLHKMMWGTRGWACLGALRKIAEGHNDPRALAQEVLNRVEDKE